MGRFVLLVRADLAPPRDHPRRCLFSNVLERAYDGGLVPVLGFLLLPWTMLAYAWMYDLGPGLQVDGLEWILVGLAC